MIPYLSMFIAILSAVFMAAVMMNDCIFLKPSDPERPPVMTDALQMLVVSSIFPTIALIVSLSGGVPLVATKYMIGAFVVGVFWTASNAAYFEVTKMTNDFTMVALVDASYPVLMALLGLLFGFRLPINYWVGIVGVIATLFALNFWFRGERGEVKNPRKYYSLLFAHVGALTVAMFGFDYLLKIVGEEHYTSIYVPYLAAQTVGFLALLSPDLRENFRKDWPKIQRFWPALLVGEICFMLALACLTWAMKVYPGAVVAALGGSYPLVIFLAGPLVRRIEFFRRFGNMEKTFPPQEGPKWKKIVIFIGNAASLGMLAPKPAR